MSAMLQPHSREHYWTLDEYLIFDRASQQKHEYLDGRVYDMVGGSEAHNVIIGNTFASLHSQLRRKPCKVYVESMRVVTPSKLATFPDVIVVCGDVQLKDDHRDTLLNPTVIIEVLSPSTAFYDRGAKWAEYKTIPSLRDYLLIKQDEAEIEHFSRTADTEWTDNSVIRRGLDQVFEIPSITAVLALSDVYEKINFEQDAEQKGG